MTPPTPRCPRCGGNLLADGWERGTVVCMLCSREFQAVDVVTAVCGYRPGRKA